MLALHQNLPLKWKMQWWNCKHPFPQWYTVVACSDLSTHVPFYRCGRPEQTGKRHVQAWVLLRCNRHQKCEYSRQSFPFFSVVLKLSWEHEQVPMCVARVHSHIFCDSVHCVFLELMQPKFLLAQSHKAPLSNQTTVRSQVHCFWI